MDEIGRGTSTYDGLSIAWAVVEYLHDLRKRGVKTLFATHYHELIELAETKARVRNFNIAVREWKDQVIFLRKLVPGGTNRSYGIQVARLAGLPADVIERSKKILARVENSAAPGAEGPGQRPETEETGPVQLDLFRSKDAILLSQIEHIDVNRTTPMEALEILQSLQEKARSLSN
jgi:DNA mismatch repair protein MutS